MDQSRLNQNALSVKPKLLKKDLVFKFLVIGDYGVGKTAIVRRFTEGKFSSNYKTTIGADFSVRTIQWDANTRISLQLWDIAGHAKFGYMTRGYYRYAVGCAIVFDVSRYSSYESVEKWLKDLHQNVMLDDGREIPVVLCANKWDIGDSRVTEETINRLSQENNFRAWFKTSAKENLNINEVMNSLIEGAISASVKPDAKKDSIVLEEKIFIKRESSCCN